MEEVLLYNRPKTITKWSDNKWYWKASTYFYLFFLTVDRVLKMFKAKISYSPLRGPWRRAELPRSCCSQRLRLATEAFIYPPLLGVKPRACQPAPKPAFSCGDLPHPRIRASCTGNPCPRIGQWESTDTWSAQPQLRTTLKGSLSRSLRGAKTSLDCIQPKFSAQSRGLSLPASWTLTFCLLIARSAFQGTWPATPVSCLRSLKTAGLDNPENLHSVTLRRHPRNCGLMEDGMNYWERVCNIFQGNFLKEFAKLQAWGDKIWIISRGWWVRIAWMLHW